MRGLDVVSLTRNLVRHPSVTGSEKKVANYTEKLFQQQFPTSEVHRVGNSVFVRIPGKNRNVSNRRALVFNGHYDVVPPGKDDLWTMGKPFSARARRVKGERVMVGRGTADMKGGLAAEICAVKKILSRGKPEHDIWIAAVEDEENDGWGSRQFSQFIREKGWLATYTGGISAVIAEPTNDMAFWAPASMGHQGFEITFRKGTEGIWEAARFTKALHDQRLLWAEMLRAQQGNTPYELDGAAPKATVTNICSSGEIDTSCAINQIPPQAYLVLETSNNATRDAVNNGVALYQSRGVAVEVFEQSNGRFVLNFSSEGGHAATPDSKRSPAAIDVAAEILCGLEKHKCSLKPLAFGIGKAPSELKDVNERAPAVLIDVRLLGGVGVPPKEVLAFLNNQVAVLHTRMENKFEPLPTFFNDPEKSRIARAIRAVVGEKLACRLFPAACDASYLQGLGGVFLDTIVVGPGMIERIHKPDEYVRVEALRQARNLFINVYEQWAAT
ncbi:MAG: M20/M25/M40 family metallo-hydrolase [bacterium]